MRRRDFLTLSSVLAAWPLAAGLGLWPGVAHAALALGEGSPFSVAALRARARALAGESYTPPNETLPRALVELGYDRYRDIRFRPQMALWREEGLPFQAQFFHLGSYFTVPTHIHVVDGGTAREVLYTGDLFDYGANEFAEPFPETLGFAGFRLHYPLNRPDHHDELAVFLGASYFRSLARGQQYGLSARGLAIDTALPKGEEFPIFREFWLERPGPGAGQVVIHALLDSPSAAGAYSFTITPGDTTVMDVSAMVYPRQRIERMGIAPLTSMYFFGENDRLGVDDFRPQVHDSDGLSMWTGGGEWIWRPLVNPQRLRVSAYSDVNPRGFGLLQRTRDFDEYQDLEAHYERRPSLWVEPIGGWGRGVVQLVEIPTLEEIHDNIVAFWVPEAPVEPGSEWPLAYRLHWCAEPPQRPGFGSKLIERTLSYELQGSAELDYRPAGLVATFDLPLAGVAGATPPAGVPRAAGAVRATRDRAARPERLAGKRILIVEDQHVIAEQVARILRDAGCAVAGPAATLEHAVRLAEQEPLDAAVLDINLDGAMVWPVTEVLGARGVPFLFATGYAETLGAPPGVRDTPRIEKPIEAARLRAALADLL